MAKRKKIKSVPVKELNRQLATWKREFPSIYEDIERLAKEQGILTKSGKITQNKAKSKKVKLFKEQYKQQYGSYTSWKQKTKTRLKAQIEYEKTLPKKERKSWKQIEQERTEYNELLDEFFKIFSGDDKDKTYEEFVYLERMDRTTAIKRLKDEIEQQTILPPIKEYKSKYGDFSNDVFGRNELFDV